ncbi:MAG: hydantoinase/oxoprolinase family protein [Acidobacteriota bacterium]
MRVGVDTGGTFTDCVVADGKHVRVVKVFSGSPASPEEASLAIVDGVRRLIAETRHNSVDIIHGTTVSTNSLLERRGARVALVTTLGFEDLIEIGRQARPRLYDLDVRRDSPLVQRRMRWGLQERTSADGTVLIQPSDRELRKLRDRIKRSGAESVAVCLLFSFSNPKNERSVLRALRSLKIPLSISHQILPEFREYERLSTTTINAYLMPLVGSYLSRLEREASVKLFIPDTSRAQPGAGDSANRTLRSKKRASVSVFVMESSGGITTARQAAREPVRTILSGPAGGVAAATGLARRLGIRQAISFDMGGTSTDVCLFEGNPRITNETTVGGLPVAVPVIDIHSVGAGGGSQARIDAGGALRVGPESAGASPGPVCYGRGGQRPTVTDANLILGRIDADYFLGGTFRLDQQATEEAFRNFIGDNATKSLSDHGMLRTPLELARGIIAVANANMERALRVISVERGHDPRDFTLIPFGGAGGLQAADLARSLGITRIIIPPNPGTFSALGILLSDAVKDVSQSVLLAVPEETPHGRSSAFRRCLKNIGLPLQLLERVARAELRRDRFPSGKIHIEKQVDVRYAGQSYELTVPFSPRRLRLTIPTARPQRSKSSGKRSVESMGEAVVKKKNVWFGNRFYRTPLYDRDRIGVGTQFSGPAVVVEYSSTTAVPPDFMCNIDEHFNLVLTHNEDRSGRTRNL